MDTRINPTHDVRGSLWHRWDLHFHTPSSGSDYENQAITNAQIVDALIKQEIRVVAITDHHTIDIERIKELNKIADGRITILPGIELRDEHGGEPIHYICIFPEDSNLEHVWTTLQGGLGLTPIAIQQKGGEDQFYVPIGQGAEIVRKLNGIISIHAGAKSNSIESIKNKAAFQQRLKYDITSKWVDLMEIGQLKDIDTHLNKIFPDTGLDKPLIICSDNHNALNYKFKAPMWLRADPVFRGLLMVLREPRSRVYIGEKPPQLTRIERNPTKYIHSISFTRKTSAPATEQWFDGLIPLNPGLVAIVGNKGSGKSALSDTLGLLGSTKNGAWFSFLSEQRFKHPTKGYANHFNAEIEWESGAKLSRCLGDEINLEEVERVKYLPQDHVERICNEIVGVDGESFEQELKSVIFSHVPDAQRLGFRTLDTLVQFRTEEKQKRIDSLAKQLSEINRTRSNQEMESDPIVRRRLEEQIMRKELELESHDKAKPIEQSNPSLVDPTQKSNPLLDILASKELIRKEIAQKIAIAAELTRLSERRFAVAKRILEKLSNFKKDFDVLEQELQEDTKELKIVPAELIKLSIDVSSVEKIRDESEATIKSQNEIINAIEPPGLQSQLSNVEKEIGEINLQLDAPNRAYQEYLKNLAEWQSIRNNIIGQEREPESLNGLKSSLLALNELPEKTNALRAKQLSLALEIHLEKAAQVLIYRELYSTVQNFIDSHELAKDKIKLEFRAELSSENFTKRLLGLLALNRRGSFMGIDEGNQRSEKLVKTTRWDEPDSVKEFLQNIDNALHQDQRDPPLTPTQLKDQVTKGTTPDEVYNLLYSLEYLRPKYILKWDGKELSMLSPGERGTLLLVFYLLIEKGDMPLIIDQPEGNLDNHTIAKVLIDCIRMARENRQVFIVTHNPNLAVVCDADQIIYSSMDKIHGDKITYTTGSLENPIIAEHVTDVLEGTRWAFDKRGAKYEVAKAFYT
jgi:hypothetical protein